VARRSPSRKARIVFARRTPSPGSGLHQCRVCHDEFVVPVCWEEVDDERWHMLLRCAQCETYRDVIVNNDVAKVYERDLDRGRAEIAATLERRDRARMVAEVHVFIAALERDLIDAADFAPR
jgi:transcription elongation factor Elf1